MTMGLGVLEPSRSEHVPGGASRHELMNHTAYTYHPRHLFLFR